MWERFSTSGLAGSYLDDLTAAGMKARMEFRPRRVLDPFPFLVIPVEEEEKDGLSVEQAACCVSGHERGGRSRPI